METWIASSLTLLAMTRGVTTEPCHAVAQERRTRCSLLVGVARDRVRPDPLPDAIAAPGETVVLTLHAEGAQVYECKAGTDGKLAWAFREPIATLLLDGKTVGRHYAGPNWEHIDGSAVVGKAVGNAPGATPNDIPWLKLDRDLPARHGILSGSPRCSGSTPWAASSTAPATRPAPISSAPYSADYVFLRKG